MVTLIVFWLLTNYMLMEDKLNYVKSETPTEKENTLEVIVIKIKYGEEFPLLINKD